MKQTGLNKNVKVIYLSSKNSLDTFPSSMTIEKPSYMYIIFHFHVCLQYFIYNIAVCILVYGVVFSLCSRRMVTYVIDDLHDAKGKILRNKLYRVVLQ